MRTLLFVVALSTLSPASARAASERHLVYGEALGAGLGFTMSYEHRVASWLGLRGGAGYSFFSVPGSDANDAVNLVLSASGLYSLGGAHHLEVSLGFGYLRAVGDDLWANTVSLLGGYRYQSPGGGLFVRALLGPALLSRSRAQERVLLLPGLAVGWAF